MASIVVPHICGSNPNYPLAHYLPVKNIFDQHDGYGKTCK